MALVLGSKFQLGLHLSYVWFTWSSLVHMQYEDLDSLHNRKFALLYHDDHTPSTFINKSLSIFPVHFIQKYLYSVCIDSIYTCIF